MVGEYKKVEIGKSRFNVELNRAERECKTREWNRERLETCNSGRQENEN
jgi:hypothetical protein